jgi:hypothetical protein
MGNQQINPNILKITQNSKLQAFAAVICAGAVQGCRYSAGAQPTYAVPAQKMTLSSHQACVHAQMWLMWPPSCAQSLAGRMHTIPGHHSGQQVC